MVMKMKKRLLFFYFLLLYSAAYPALIKTTDSLPLTGTVEVVCELKIEPLLESLNAGMPFDLESEGLAEQGGRSIATWSLLYPGPRARIEVTASPLKGVENSCELDYELLVGYSFYIRGSEKEVQTGTLACSTKTGTPPCVLSLSTEEWECIEIQRSPICLRLFDAADVQYLPPGRYEANAFFDVTAI